MKRAAFGIRAAACRVVRGTRVWVAAANELGDPLTRPGLRDGELSDARALERVPARTVRTSRTNPCYPVVADVHFTAVFAFGPNLPAPAKANEAKHV